jgi:hypothetical protein
MTIQRDEDYWWAGPGPSDRPDEVTITRARYDAYQKCEAKLKDLLEAAEAYVKDTTVLTSTDLLAAIERART